MGGWRSGRKIASVEDLSVTSRSTSICFAALSLYSDSRLWNVRWFISLTSRYRSSCSANSQPRNSSAAYLDVFEQLRRIAASRDASLWRCVLGPHSQLWCQEASHFELHCLFNSPRPRCIQKQTLLSRNLSLIVIKARHHSLIRYAPRSKEATSN
jgi:hypothetical protein